MSLYLTELTQKENNNNQLEKTKDKFINYIIQEEAQFANLQSIEEQLQLSSKSLKEKIDKNNLIIAAKQKEIEGLISQINTSVQELYQFNLELFSGINFDDIIKEKRELIKIKEHDFHVYRYMQARIYNTNRLLLSRIHLEQQYENKTLEQASYYKIIHNKVSKDFNKQSQIYASLNKKKEENDEVNDKVIKHKDILFKTEQEKLEEQKALNEQLIRYYSYLLNEKRAMLQSIGKVNQCNMIQYKEYKNARREYHRNRILLNIITKLLSTKQLSNIIGIVKEKQKKHNEIFCEFIFLNNAINKYSDQNKKYDQMFIDINNSKFDKDQKEEVFATEYSDLILQIKDCKIKRMQFRNHQLEIKCMNKEAMIQTLVSFLFDKNKVFNDYNNKRNNNSNQFKSQFQYTDLLSNNRNYNSNNYSLCITQFSNIFNFVSYHYLSFSFNSMKSSMIKADNKANIYKDNNSLIIILPNEETLMQLNKKVKVTNKSVNSNDTLMPQLSPISISNKNNVIPTKITKKKAMAKKTNSEIMIDFKTYLKSHKELPIFNYVTKFPKKSITHLSKYYSAANSEITSASSMKNKHSSNHHLISFRKRIAYDKFNKTRQLSRKQLIQIKSFLSNRSQHELNDDSYELCSNRQSSSQTRKKSQTSRPKWPKEDSDQKRMKARMNELYKMEVKANDKQALKNTQELMEVCFKYETKKNRKYNLQSAYSMKNLMSSGFYRDITTPKIIAKRYKLDTPNYFVNTNSNTNCINSAENRNAELSRGPSSFVNTKNNFLY